MYGCTEDKTQEWHEGGILVESRNATGIVYSCPHSYPSLSRHLSHQWEESIGGNKGHIWGCVVSVLMFGCYQ